ncbi:unnamed protein product, partial [Ixodes persulcatus]
MGLIFLTCSTSSPCSERRGAAAGGMRGCQLSKIRTAATLQTHLTGCGGYRWMALSAAMIPSSKSSITSLSSTRRLRAFGG